MAMSRHRLMHGCFKKLELRTLNTTSRRLLGSKLLLYGLVLDRARYRMYLLT
jgi:hypothetical protein